MKTHICNLCVVLVALGGTWLCGVSSPATAEQLHYEFDFNDGTVPDVLEVNTLWVDPPNETLTCDASSGQLRIYDTVPAACGVYHGPDPVFTDTHVSAVFSPGGGALRNSYSIGARMTESENEVRYYSCFLWPTPATNGFKMVLQKIVNGERVAAVQTEPIYAPGPYFMELDVVDSENTTGEYTDLSARLTYDNGQERSLSLQDLGYFGPPGSQDRLTSGQVFFGAGLGTAHRDAGWVLDATLDDLSITGTLVPEPGGIVLLLTGFIVLFMFRRQK